MNTHRFSLSAAIPLLLCLAHSSLANNIADPVGRTAKLSRVGAEKASPVRPGGYYLDDGPAEFTPPNLHTIPDAEPRFEPPHRFANNPYSVFGTDYVPLRTPTEFKQRGMASWYGRRFHGQRTSSGEPYDMFAMTAAHPTLPIPSYVRVTHVGSGKSVVVRINDRGPFHSDRVIDLSYTAAVKLGYANAGSTLVEVESIVPEGALAAMQARPAAEPDLIEQIILRDATPKPAAPIDLPAVNESRGVFLQLAAFSNPDNADSFRTHLTRELGALAEKLVLHVQDGRYRLRLGPYANPAEASSVADRLRQMLDLKPVLVTR